MTTPADPHLWPPETRTAHALEALRDQIAQRMSDLEQDAAGLPHVPLGRQRLAGEYRAAADQLMGVVGAEFARVVHEAEERGAAMERARSVG